MDVSWSTEPLPITSAGPKPPSTNTVPDPSTTIILTWLWILYFFCHSALLPSWVLSSCVYCLLHKSRMHQTKQRLSTGLWSNALFLCPVKAIFAMFCSQSTDDRGVSIQTKTSSFANAIWTAAYVVIRLRWSLISLSQNVLGVYIKQVEGGGEIAVTWGVCLICFKWFAS